MNHQQQSSFSFFDLDHTLIPVDSSGLWSYFLISKCDDKAEAFKQIQQKFDEDYFKGILEINEFMDFEMMLLARFPRKELEAMRKEYMARFIEPHICENALKIVAEHKARGDRVVIVTATYRFVVEKIVELLGADDLIAAEPEEDARGEFTGGWICHNFQTGKIRSVEKYLSSRGGVDCLKHSYFYSDSVNDIPLLDYVDQHGGKAVATNPDPILSDYAAKKGWDVVHLFSTVKPTAEKISE